MPPARTALHGALAAPLHRALALTLALVLGGCAATAPPPEATTPPAPQAQATPPSPLPAPPVALQAQAAPTLLITDPAPQDDAAPVAVQPIDPLQPGLRIDPGAAITRIDLWQRIRDGFGMPELANDRVRMREQWYATRPDYVQRMADRGSRYLFHVVEEVTRRGLPTELALLPFIESAFNPQAVSSARAAGMWQFMPATGRDFDLRQNLFRDDRRDVLASTRAALDYLEDLHRMFGDWHLALAAYNWGQGSVQRAIARNQKAGLPTDYWSLNLPAETRDYVPKLQAVKNLVAAPAQYGVELPPLENHPYFLSVPIERDIDVDLAVRLAGVPVEEFRYLNPQMNKPVILAAGTPQILLPYDAANRFADALRAHRGPLASWTAWVAPRTLRVADAAKLTGMSEARLREVNRIPPRMRVSAGSTLLVPRGEHRTADVSEHVADNARLALTPEAPPLKRVAFRAGKKGTTVAAVARKYRVSAGQVAQWNRTSADARFKPGATVVVYVPQKARAVAKSGSSRKSAARASGASSAKATSNAGKAAARQR